MSHMVPGTNFRNASTQRPIAPMLAFSSAGGRRHGSVPDRGDAWRRRTPSVFTTSMDLKQQQLLAEQHQQFESDTTPIDETQPEEAPVEPPEPPRRRSLTKFRLMAYQDSEDEEESDYVPSDDEEEESEEEGGAEELLEHYQEETAESEEEEEVLNDDTRWWKSREDKRRWEMRYRQADAAFRKRFGCGIDTLAHPETRRKVRKHKTRYRAYKCVLTGLMIAYLVYLAVVYSASSWAFSMVAGRPSTTENDDTLTDTRSTTGRHVNIVSKPADLSSQQVPEHVRTGLHLCSTLSRRVVKSEHDVTATQHAFRACDIAIKFAPLKSRESIEAHVLRGDLRSLLSNFDGADEDYNAAMTLTFEFESSSLHPKLTPELPQDLDLKLIANRWTQLYKTKHFKELRREAKARTAQIVDQHGVINPVNAVSELAANWLSAFKKKMPVLDVLTLQRGYTLRRLKYEALDDDNKTKPGEV